MSESTPAPTPMITPQRLDRWRMQLSIHDENIRREPSSRRAWGWQIQVEMLLYLLGRFDHRPQPAAQQPDPSVPHSMPGAPGAPADGQPMTPPPAPPGAVPPPMPADAASPPVSRQATPTPPTPPPLPPTRPVNDRLARPQVPDVPEGMGRAPRTADSFRGKLSRLASVNRARHEVAEQERDILKSRIEVERRHRVLYEPMRRYGLFIEAHEFDFLTKTRNPPDFTVKEFYEYLMSKNTEAICQACRYSLRGLPPQGHCPECGATYFLNTIRIEVLLDLLSRDNRPGQPLITPDTWMMHHMGYWNVM